VLAGSVEASLEIGLGRTRRFRSLGGCNSLWRRKGGACIDPHGFDAGKLIKGKKRHILVDMQGLLLYAIVHSAGVQDRDGGIWLLATLFGQFPFLAKLFADSAYAGSIFHTALAGVLPNLETEIVKRCDRARGFVPLLPLKMDGGTFVVPVQINGTMTPDFVIDSGATDVSVPADVVSTLMRADTIQKGGFYWRTNLRFG
jgi:hypothetical protein